LGGTVAYLPSFWALSSAFLSTSAAAAAAAVGFINCTASIGGFVGPKIIGNLSQRTGSFNSGFIFMIACWTIAALLVLLCPRQNRTLNISGTGADGKKFKEKIVYDKA
jgi:ACS family tartrate transporter-like MFS transporter